MARSRHLAPEDLRLARAPDYLLTLFRKLGYRVEPEPVPLDPAHLECPDRAGIHRCFLLAAPPPRPPACRSSCSSSMPSAWPACACWSATSWWRVDWEGLYVIFTWPGVEIERYPAIRTYLEPFRERLEQRATSANHAWYELQQP